MTPFNYIKSLFTFGESVKWDYDNMNADILSYMAHECNKLGSVIEAESRQHVLYDEALKRFNDKENELKSVKKDYKIGSKILIIKNHNIRLSSIQMFKIIKNEAVFKSTLQIEENLLYNQAFYPIRSYLFDKYEFKWKDLGFVKIKSIYDYIREVYQNSPFSKMKVYNYNYASQSSAQLELWLDNGKYLCIENINYYQADALRDDLLKYIQGWQGQGYAQ